MKVSHNARAFAIWWRTWIQKYWTQLIHIGSGWARFQISLWIMRFEQKKSKNTKRNFVIIHNNWLKIHKKAFFLLSENKIRMLAVAESYQSIESTSMQWMFLIECDGSAFQEDACNENRNWFYFLDYLVYANN